MPPDGGGDDPLRLVVLGDSTAFTDHRGPQLPHDPGLYPQVAARRLRELTGRAVDVAVLASAGTTVRDAVRTVTKDRHAQFEVLARADAVIVGLGGFDHAPAGVPPSIEALAAFLRPTWLRRRVRTLLRASYPWLVRVHGGSRPRTPRGEFVRLFDLLLLQLRGLMRGEAAGVVLGPTSHRSPYYAHRDRAHAPGEARQLDLARRHGFASVPVWPHVVVHAADLNVDGIHWPGAAHTAVGTAAADALAAQLRGDVARPTRPGQDRSVEVRGP